MPSGAPIRKATGADLDAILALSRITPWNKEAYLRRQLRNGCIDVACENETIVGFIAWNREFFSKPFVWLVVVDPVKRHGGIGAQLFAHLERQCKGDRLYSSTNASDPGDPEVFYYLDL